MYVFYYDDLIEADMEEAQVKKIKIKKQDVHTLDQFLNIVIREKQ